MFGMIELWRGLESNVEDALQVQYSYKVQGKEKWKLLGGKTMKKVSMHATSHSRFIYFTVFKTQKVWPKKKKPKPYLKGICILNNT